MTLEILKSYFVAIAEGMGYTLERTSHTTFIKESADFVTRQWRRRAASSLPTRGRSVFPASSVIDMAPILAVPGSAPRRCGTSPTTLQHPGPGHAISPTSTSFKPVFAGGELLCFAWCFIHCSDVGGLAPASISPRAFDIHQEGFRIPPRKL